MSQISRVLVVNDFARINGGQAKVAIESARMLADAGVEVTFFASCGPASDLLDHPKIDTVLLDQQDILSDPDRLAAARRGIWNNLAASRLRSISDAFNPASTVIHCHGFAKALSPSIGPVMTDGPLGSLYTIHEYFLACPNGGFYDYRRNEICHRKPLGADCLTTNCDVRHAAHKAWRVARQVAARQYGMLPGGLRDIAYISNLQKEVLTPYLPQEAELHHIPNPTTPSTRKVDPSANEIFLFIGRLSYEKGACLFAEAAKMAGATSVFVGEGPEADQIKAINPEANITGWLAPSEVNEWIARARCLVFPSLWYECQPLVPMEALSMGVPVISGSWTAARESVEHGVTGLLIDAPEPALLAEAMTQLMDPDCPVFSRLASRPVPLTSPEAHLSRLLEVYDHILAKRDGARLTPASGPGGTYT